MEDGLPAGLAQAFFQTSGDARLPWHFQPVHFPGDWRLTLARLRYILVNLRISAPHWFRALGSCVLVRGCL